MLVVLLSIAMGACNGPTPMRTDRHARFTFHLEFVRQYGLPFAMLDTVSHLRSAAGGGVLVSIASAAVGRDSALYVLDSYYRKIVAYRPDGQVGRIILGGFGEGPGEFLEPRDLAVGENGVIWVVDVGNGRVSAFGPGGEYLRGFRVPDRQVHRIATRGGKLWLSVIYGTQARYSSIVVDERGNFLHNGFRITGARERVAASTGNPGILGKSSDRIVFALGDPGPWIELGGRDHEQRVLGTPIFPDEATVDVRGPRRVLLAQTRGVGLLPGGDVALMYGHIDIHRGESQVGVDFFNRGGEYLGTVLLDSSFAMSRTFAASSESGHLYIDRYSPYPHMDEFRVVREPASASYRGGLEPGQ